MSKTIHFKDIFDIHSQFPLSKKLSDASKAIYKDFTALSKSLKNTKRSLYVTGAGISVSSGIPDFRSADGLYSKVLTNHSLLPKEGKGFKKDEKVIKAAGKDFFDINFFQNPKTRPLFNLFVIELKRLCHEASPSSTHHWIKDRCSDGNVLRWYTQNIDGLENNILCNEKHSDLLILLHGTLNLMKCTFCRHSMPWELNPTKENDHSHTVTQSLSQGNSPDCPKCEIFNADRKAKGQRPVRIGSLRPDIVLYNEMHHEGVRIGLTLSSDISKKPNILIIIGTSLKVTGLKRMVKDIAKSVHKNQNGLVVYINKTPVLPCSEWEGVFDYELVGESDKWFNLIDEVSSHIVSTPAIPTEIITPIPTDSPSILTNSPQRFMLAPGIKQQRLFRSSNLAVSEILDSKTIANRTLTIIPKSPQRKLSFRMSRSGSSSRSSLRLKEQKVEGKDEKVNNVVNVINKKVL